VIEQGLYDYLRSLAGVVAIAEDRIFPVQAPPDATFPRVVYTLIDDGAVRNLQGPCGTITGRYQIDCYALSYAVVKALALAIRGTKAEPKLDGFRGDWGDNLVQSVRCEAFQDLHEVPAHGEGVGIYRVQFDAIITYQE